MPSPPLPTHCTATTLSGTPCCIPPRTSGLCHVHDPASQCGAPRTDGGRCTVATGGRRCREHAAPSTPSLRATCPECHRPMALTRWAVPANPGARILYCHLCGISSIGPAART